MWGARARPHRCCFLSLGLLSWTRVAQLALLGGALGPHRAHSRPSWPTGAFWPFCVGSGPCPLSGSVFKFGPQLGHSTSLCVFLCVSELCPNFFGLFIRMYPTSDGPSDHADSLLLFPARFACSPLSLPRSLCSLAVFARPARLLAAAAVAAFCLFPSCSLAAPRSLSLSLSLSLCPSHAPAGSRAKGRLTTAAPASAMAQGKRREGTEIKQT